MTFKTMEDWELKGIYEVFSPNGERNYPLFEANLFGNYFILDGRQILKEDAEEDFDMGRRFFVSNFINTLKVIKQFEGTDIHHESIALLHGANYSDTGDYNSSIIEEVIHCKDQAGQDAWIYLLKNGMRVVDSVMTNKEVELIKKDVLYTKNDITDYGQSFLEA